MMAVKECSDQADNPQVKFDLAHPTQPQVRQGLISGLIAASITVPVLLTVALIDHHRINWSYVGAAIACLLASVVYLALRVALSKGAASPETRATVVFVMVCLVLAALGLLELGTSAMFGILTPAVLVGVVFTSIVGDRQMRIAIDVYAIVVVGIVAWAADLRGGTLVGAVLMYASTIVIITCITARAATALHGRTNLRQSIAALNEALDDEDPDSTGTNSELITAMLRRGLPSVPQVLAAERMSVWAKDARLGRFELMAEWPDGPEDTDRAHSAELGRRPELDQALRSDSIVLTPSFWVIPIGYCADGELVMVLERPPSDGLSELEGRDTAEAIAAAFLRATSRLNFASGLHEEIRTDPLTGLANRRILFERIQIEMDHALRSESPLSVAMLDLDHFREFNEENGHIAGDTVLRSLAAVMVSNVRRQDLVCRYGGEEFFLVMPDTDIVGGHHILDKLRAGGRDATTDVAVTLSAGLTSWDGIEDVASLVERADQALYRAKESGRDRVVSIQTSAEF
jgi:diguanylate cyclase (GGDEF)-like protein